MLLRVTSYIISDLFALVYFSVPDSYVSGVEAYVLFYRLVTL